VAAFKHGCGLVPTGLRVAALLIWSSLALPLWALAADFDVELEAARAAVESKDPGALDQIEAADAAAISGERVVLARQAASLDFYRGVLHWQAQETDAAMDAWRRALIIDPTFAPDGELLGDMDALDLIEALRSETQQKEMRAPGLDEETPGVRVYISGQLMHSYDLLFAGRQLVQVLCPDGSLRGWWHVYGDAPDYAGACSLPQPAYTAFALEDAGKPPKTSREPRESNPALLGYGLVGSGALAIGVGVAVLQLQVKPAYTQVEAARAAPGSVTRAQADQLSADFNRARLISLGLVGVGGLAVGAGAAQLTVGPQGVSLTGEF
jgi:hypothetical protein